MKQRYVFYTLRVGYGKTAAHSLFFDPSSSRKPTQEDLREKSLADRHRSEQLKCFAARSFYLTKTTETNLDVHFLRVLVLMVRVIDIDSINFLSFSLLRSPAYAFSPVCKHIVSSEGRSFLSLSVLFFF